MALVSKHDKGRKFFPIGFFAWFKIYSMLYFSFFFSYSRNIFQAYYKPTLHKDTVGMLP